MLKIFGFVIISEKNFLKRLLIVDDELKERISCLERNFDNAVKRSIEDKKMWEIERNCFLETIAGDKKKSKKKQEKSRKAPLKNNRSKI